MRIGTRVLAAATVSWLQGALLAGRLARSRIVRCLQFGGLLSVRRRDRPLSAVEMLTIRAVSEEEGILPPSERGKEPPGSILWWVRQMAGLAGHHPSKRRPLPGHEVIWQAHHLLQPMVRGTEAILKALHRQQTADLRGRHWPMVPTWQTCKPSSQPAGTLPKSSIQQGPQAFPSLPDPRSQGFDLSLGTT